MAIQWEPCDIYPAMVKSDPKAQASKRKQAIFSLFAVLIICLLTFAPALENGFVNWDDSSHLLRNHTVRSLDAVNIKKMFSSLVQGTYIPLTLLSFSIESHFFQYDPFIYHLNNIILHLCVVGLVYLFALNIGLSVKAASLSALLFGIHPMRVESVVWVSERKDVLCAFFYLLSGLLYFRYLKTRRSFYFPLSLLCGFLSILSKPMAATLPFILIYGDFVVARKRNWKMWLEKFIFFLAILPVAWITFSHTSHHISYSFFKTLLLLLWTSCFHILKFLFPFDLCPIYPLPEPIVLSHTPYLLSLICLALCILAYLFIRRRLVRFALIFYLITLLPIIIRSPWNFENISIVSDRFMYLPSLGFCLLFGAMVGRFLDRYRTRKALLRLLASSIFILFFVFLSFRTFEQSKIWRSSQSLWSHVIALFPDSAIAYNNRGAAQTHSGLALMDFDQTLRLDPTFREAYFNRGNIYHQIGMHSRAIADYTRYVSLDPFDAEIYHKRSLAYKSLGDVESSDRDANKARLLGYVK